MRHRKFESDDKIKGLIHRTNTQIPHNQRAVIHYIRGASQAKEDQFFDEVSRVNQKYDNFLNRMNVHKLQKQVDMTKRHYHKNNMVNHFIEHTTQTRPFDLKESNTNIKSVQSQLDGYVKRYTHKPLMNQLRGQSSQDRTIMLERPLHTDKYWFI